jgi:hypothetical protein
MMQNTLRNFIQEMDFSACKTLETEMDFSKHKTPQWEWVEMGFCMAVPRISVEWVKATDVVMMATVMLLQRSIAISSMTILVEVSLHLQVRDRSASTLVSLRKTRVFRSALTALTEACEL